MIKQTILHAISRSSGEESKSTTDNNSTKSSNLDQFGTNQSSRKITDSELLQQIIDSEQQFTQEDEEAKRGNPQGIHLYISLVQILLRDDPHHFLELISSNFCEEFGSNMNIDLLNDVNGNLDMQNVSAMQTLKFTKVDQKKAETAQKNCAERTTIIGNNCKFIQYLEKNAGDPLKVVINWAIDGYNQPDTQNKKHYYGQILTKINQQKPDLANNNQAYQQILGEQREIDNFSLAEPPSSSPVNISSLTINSATGQNKR